MIKRTLDGIMRGKLAAGVDITLLPDGTFSISVVQLKKVKSQLVIEKSKEELTSIEALAGFINVKQPVCIVLNGKGIVHRKVTASAGDSPAALLNKVLPNANVDEFNIQQIPVSSTHAIVSVIRSAIVETVIEALAKVGITGISSFTLGPFAVNNILPLLAESAVQNDRLLLENYQLQLQDRQIVDITAASLPGEQVIQVGNDLLSHKLLVPFAAAVMYFTVDRISGITGSSIIDTLKEEYSQKRKFVICATAVLAVLFFVLMVNYLVFNHYWTRNQELSGILTSNQMAMAHYDTLTKQLSYKKEFLEQHGLLEGSRTSFYVDRLASLLPASVQWTDVTVHPLKKKKTAAEGEGIAFEKEIIRVAGRCQKSTDLNSWMKNVKRKDWVNSVTLLNYAQPHEADDGHYLLEIKLNN